MWPMHSFQMWDLRVVYGSKRKMKLNGAHNYPNAVFILLSLFHTTCSPHDDVIKWKLFSALLALCAGNSPVTGEFPSQKPVTRSFDVFFDLRLNKRLRKQSWGWQFETLSRSLWRHRNVKFDNRVYNDESLANTFVHCFLLSSFQQGAPRERNVRSNLFLPTVAQDKMPYCQM